MKISATIITFNEERNIRRCLESLVPVADEIVVVDSFSKDNTENICKEFGVRFIQNTFGGHIEQKNFAIDQASHPWILSLDADEALDSALTQSILELKKTNPSHKGYRFNRLTNYCGTWIRHSGWYPDTKVRLVLKSEARWMGVNPHDRLEVIDGSSTGFLVGDLLHYSYYTQEDHLKQIEFFSGIASKELFKKNKKVSWPMIILKVIVQYIKNLIIKVGFLDGRAGFTIARLSAYATYRKYYKLMMLHRENKS